MNRFMIPGVGLRRLGEQAACLRVKTANLSSARSDVGSGCSLTSGDGLGDVNVSSLHVSSCLALAVVVSNGSLDGVFGQHRAVEL